MKRTLLIIVLFYFGSYLHAQMIFDTKADLIGVKGNILNFYKKLENGKYEQFSLVLKVETNGEIVLKKIHNSVVEEPKYQDEIIAVENLLQIRPKTLKRAVKNEIYLKKVNEVEYRNRYDILFVLENYNNYDLFSFEQYELRDYIDPETKRENNKWNFNSRAFYSYYFLRINQNKTIMVFTEWLYENFEKTSGFLFPLKSSSLSVKGFLNYSTPFIELKHADLDSVMWSKIDQSTITRNWQDLYKINSDFQVKNTFNQTLSNKKFDTLSMKYGFIIGKRKEEVAIFNDKLIDITPQNLRAAFFNNNGYCQVLVNNEIKWLDDNGVLSNDMIPIINGICGYATNIEYDIIKEDGYFFYSYLSNDSFREENLTKLKLFPVSEYDDIFFLNKKTHLQYSSNSYITKEGLNYLIVKKDGKYGIKEFKIDSYQNKISGNIERNINFKTILGLEYDEIIFRDYYQPVLLMKDKLFGYHTLNKKPQYKSVEKFNENFSRFTLPNNQRGWLDILGNEFLDE